MPSVVALNKDELQVLDTWHTLLCVAPAATTALPTTSSCPLIACSRCFGRTTVDRPLYRLPVFGFFALFTGAAGNARAAIDDLVELAGGKKGLGSTRPWRNVHDPPRRQPPSRRWAPPAPCSEVIEAAWQVSHDAEALVTMRNRRRGWRPRMRYGPADVVRSIKDPAGGTAIYDNALLQRRFRRIHRHRPFPGLERGTGELPGRVLLDQPADADAMTDIGNALPFWLDRRPGRGNRCRARGDTWVSLRCGSAKSTMRLRSRPRSGPHAKHDVEGRPASRRSRSGGAGARVSSVASPAVGLIRAGSFQSGDRGRLAWPTWAQFTPVMRETIECLRSIFTGARVEYSGRVTSTAADSAARCGARYAIS